MKILHITTHMGGGAGNAISDMILHNDENEHRLMCLQQCEKHQFIDRCIKNGVEVFKEPDRKKCRDEIVLADVVILHWWHHPVMCRFLADFPDVPCRIVLWAHISGCTYPRLKKNFIDLFDKVYLTTPYSYENPEWNTSEKEQIKKKSVIVYGLGNLDSLKEKVIHQDSPGQFIVGYVGTLGITKLNEQFVDFCQDIVESIPKVRFLMVGDTVDASWLMNDIKNRQLQEYFEFTGYCDDVRSQLARMDIFGYPLNKQHFGTTENVILEAMAAELPVVLLNQNTEKYIVTHRKTGMLVNNKEEYTGAVYELYKSARMRKDIGQNARKAVFNKYDEEKNMRTFQIGLDKVRTIEKHGVCFKTIGRYPYEWFLEGLGNTEKNWFLKSLNNDDNMKESAKWHIRNCQPVLKSESKGSVLQFSYYYPEDKILQLWKDIIKEG